jgi:hypothetical protein
MADGFEHTVAQLHEGGRGAHAGRGRSTVKSAVQPLVHDLEAVRQGCGLIDVMGDQHQGAADALPQRFVEDGPISRS